MATKNLKQKVRNNGAFSLGEKKTLEQMAEAVGEISVLDADFPSTSDNTLSNITGLPTYQLQAGRKYLFKFNGLITATAASGGYQFKFNLTGTQTSAVFAGNAVFYNALTGAAIVSGTSAIVLSTSVPTVLAAAAVATARVEAFCFIQPQNDGLLSVQAAQETSSTNAVTVKRGAILEKLDLE